MTADVSPSLHRRVVAEAIGTALLLAAVVGSGIMGDRLSGGNVAIALLAHTLATGAALAALILTFGPISGAHFNPAVSFADASQGGLSWAAACVYVIAQICGAFVGVALADAMFGEPIYSRSQHVRGLSPGVERNGRDVRSLGGHLGVRTSPTRCRSIRRRRLHHGCVLVHCLDVVCESSGHARPSGDGHLRGNPAGGRSWILGGTGDRGLRSDWAVPLVGAGVA
jgi:hypothetical protein